MRRVGRRRGSDPEGIPRFEAGARCGRYTCQVPPPAFGRSPKTALRCGDTGMVRLISAHGEAQGGETGGQSRSGSTRNGYNSPAGRIPRPRRHPRPRAAGPALPPLVETLARRYRSPGAEFDDLLQAGSIGLLNAIERYDPRRSDEFAAFAVPTVAGEMKRYIRDRGATVRLPRTLHEAAGRLPKERERLTRRLARTPSDAELAEAVGILDSRARRAPRPSLGGDYLGTDTMSRRSACGLRGPLLRVPSRRSTTGARDRLPALHRGPRPQGRCRRLGISESQLGRRTRRALPSCGTSSRRTAWERRTERQPPTAPEPPEPAPPGKPAKQGGHSGRLLLRMPRRLHDDLAEAAQRENLSLNRFITATLTAAIQGGEARSRGDKPTRPSSRLARSRAGCRPRSWLNIVVVVVAAIVALVLLVIAWQNGW